jgi:hypothetical protein
MPMRVDHRKEIGIRRPAKDDQAPERVSQHRANARLRN